MISNLRGKIVDISGAVVTVDVAGVGYEVVLSANCLATVERSKEINLTIYTEVREDSIRLYGFEDKLEKQVFLLLTRVKGVGARSASDIISAVNKRALLKLISAGDINRLTAIKRIGKKTAERIVVELRDKVGEYALEGQLERLGVHRVETGALNDAVLALEALGFSRAEAEQAVKNIAPNLIASLDTGQLVKEALRYV